MVKAKYLDSLVQIGLTDKEARVYEALLTIPEASIGQLAMRTVGVTRPNLYPLLRSLSKKGLVIEAVKGKIKIFRAEPPQKLAEFIEKRKQEYKEAQMSYQLVLPQLTSDFNLASGKPNVQFFEGRTGTEKVIFDSLTSKTEVLQYVDHDAVNIHLAELNKRYVAERKRKGVKKKILMWDSPSARVTAAKQNDSRLTEIRIISGTPHAAVMMIYDNKISYQNISKDSFIGVILEDQGIAAMHRDIFKFSWEKAERINPTPPDLALVTPGLS